MFEKVNPGHPDKMADRLAGAVVDLVYERAGGLTKANPRVDYTDIEGQTDYWLTFGVYEREEVARFVKVQIDEGSIIPPFIKQECT